MSRARYARLEYDGTVSNITEDAARICGVPRTALIGEQLTKHMVTEHRTRFTCELEAIVRKTQQHGRVYCTMLGFDGIGRRLTLQLRLGAHDNVDVSFALYRNPESSRQLTYSLLMHSGRLLPAARRILSISRRATSKEVLIREGLEVLAEVTMASAGAAMEWGDIYGERAITTIGSFDNQLLNTIFRPAIMSRLTRGDVVIKETSLNGEDSGSCLLILPLVSTTAPVGIIVLMIEREAVLVPEEQQSLIILGEILGLGFKGFRTTVAGSAYPQHTGDMEATVALGRMCAGLSHEINNSATVLRNSVEQLILRGDDHGYSTIADSVIRDSLTALDAIRDLTVAMRAFGPEETSASEEIDIIRLMDTVTRSVRFYAKRGLNISVERPPDAIPSVRAKSHTLIRSLFLVFVELFDAAADSGIELSVKLSLHHEQAWVTLTLMVSAGPFSLPTVLLAQLEKGGAMMRHIVEAGGTLTHVLDHQGNLSVSISLPVADEGRRSSLPPHKQKISRRGTILIAEDEAAVIRSLRRVLERNHDILAVRTGEEAIELLKDTPQIEVVIYDVSMPRVPGPVFFEEIKRFNSLIAEKIVFVRGGAYDTEITEFLARTENPVVDKPFDLPKLSDVISLLLQPE